MHLSYIGTAYHGWQRQPNAVSVQECVEDALAKLYRCERVPIVGCGRTDTGVHAEDFYAHFDAEGLAGDDMVFKLNNILPADIAIHGLMEVADNAHARFNATERAYVYRMHLGKRPWEAQWSRQILRMPDIDRMNEAAAELIKADDFTSFARVHTDVKTHICDVRQAEWTENDGLLRFHISADRFLRNMVRAVVGTLMEIGQGKYPPEHILEVIDAKDRSAAGPSAKAIGLSLVRVHYPYLHGS